MQLFLLCYIYSEDDRCDGYRDGVSGCRDCCGTNDFNDPCVVSCMDGPLATRCNGSRDGVSGCRDCCGTNDFNDPCVVSCMAGPLAGI